MGTFVLVLLFGSGYMITNSFVVNHLVTGHIPFASNTTVPILVQKFTVSLLS